MPTEANGVQTENENDQPQARGGIIWLPERFVHFSIEIIEQQMLEAFIEAAFP
jgi:methylmalonyl-CoA/ethylmalonyl-CoA epimerase